jgi:hypothetical protein
VRCARGPVQWHAPGPSTAKDQSMAVIDYLTAMMNGELATPNQAAAADYSPREPSQTWIRSATSAHPGSSIMSCPMSG